MTVYRKEGVTLFSEWSQHGGGSIAVRERGIAELAGETFTARADEMRCTLDPPATAEVVGELLRSLRSAAGEVAERVSVAAGRAEHVFETAEERREWSEESWRAHVTLVGAGERVSLTLGGVSAGDISVELVARVAATLGVAVPATATAVGDALVLEPAASAAILPWLVGEGAAGQSTHPVVRFDGNGRLIEPAASAPWPNVFRPSYRYPPQRMPFHLRLEAPHVQHAGTGVVAVAAIGMSQSGQVLTARLLCEGSAGATVREIALTRGEWLARLHRVPGEAQWFPVGAGVWGERMVV